MAVFAIIKAVFEQGETSHRIPWEILLICRFVRTELKPLAGFR
jgi:hypothetical protein